MWSSPAALSSFAPVIVQGSVAKQDPAERGLIEITIGEVLIRLRGGVAPGMIAAVLRGLRAVS